MTRNTGDLRRCYPARSRNPGRTATDSRLFVEAARSGELEPVALGVLYRMILQRGSAGTNAAPEGPGHRCDTPCLPSRLVRRTSRKRLSTAPSCVPTSRQLAQPKNGAQATGRSRGGPSNQLHALDDGRECSRAFTAPTTRPQIAPQRCPCWGSANRPVWPLTRPTIETQSERDRATSGSGGIRASSPVARVVLDDVLWTHICTYHVSRITYHVTGSNAASAASSNSVALPPATDNRLERFSSFVALAAAFIGLR